MSSECPPSIEPTLPDRAADAKAEGEQREPEVVEVGGSGGYGWTGTCGDRREPAKRDCGAVAADGCGALGCRTEWPVYEVENQQGNTRVLCADCARGWMRR